MDIRGMKMKVKGSTEVVTVESVSGRHVKTDQGIFDIFRLELPTSSLPRLRHSTGSTSQIRKADVPKRRR